MLQVFLHKIQTSTLVKTGPENHICLQSRTLNKPCEQSNPNLHSPSSIALVTSLSLMAIQGQTKSNVANSRCPGINSFVACIVADIKSNIQRRRHNICSTSVAQEMHGQTWKLCSKSLLLMPQN